MGERGAKKNPEDEAFCQTLMAKLGPSSKSGLSYRSMFGGFGLFSTSGMFGIVRNGRLFLKADEMNRDRFERAGSAQHRPMPYWEVPERVLRSARSLRVWAGEAMGAAERAGSTKRKPGRKASKIKKVAAHKK